MYSNFRIYHTESNTFVLKADSKRFGKQAIIFESYKIEDVIRFMYENYRNKSGKIITNMRLTSRLYAKAMSTCDIENNPWYRA